MIRCVSFSAVSGDEFETMHRATRLLPAGTWPSERRVDTVTLPHELRHRRRLTMAGDGGLVFLLDLAEATLLRDGDGLDLENGGIVEVRAADEALLEITAENPGALAKLAWHLGNRHLPAAIAADRILIRPDHVIEAMLRGLGAAVRPVQAPFDPEGGAYGHDHD